ncbi:hypothetical protein ABIA39_002373 [Nocardia sp. GAS34]|uniref:PE family protein n=1 Tax=unclassified Nocardia TaxID=2637762 RepID=UPI003D241717
MADLVHFDVEIIQGAIAELHALAGRLEAAQAANSAVTHIVAPSGAEEVSFLAMDHFNEGAATHDASISQGIAELYNAAQTLQAQLAEYMAQDGLRAAGITAVQAALEI